MTQAEVNWRDLKEGDRVKVEFEATVVGDGFDGLVLERLDGPRPVYPARFLDAAKITRIERPWKVGDRFQRHGREYEVISEWKAFPGVADALPVWNLTHGFTDSFRAIELSTVTRLEPSDDR